MKPLALALPGPEVMRGLEEWIDRGDAMWVEAIPHRELDDWLLRYERWVAHAKLFLGQAFTTTEPVEVFDAEASRSLGGNVNPARRVAMQSASAPRRLKKATNVLKTYFEQTPCLPSASELKPGQDVAEARGPEIGPVFLVHGRDKGVRAEVETLLNRLEIKPTILEERPNQGMPTVIEKLEREAHPADYAIVILAPEDWRKEPGQSDWPENPNSARENVMLELGYFLGKLGRDRVTALYREGTELPTDILGTAWTSLDDHGAWRYRLANELKAAGFQVDLNMI